jgi:hypothetical protein
MAPLYLPNGFKYKFLFSINVPSVIKVGSSSEGGDVVVVCSASKCITLEVDVGAENVATKCGDVLNINPINLKNGLRNGKLIEIFRMFGQQSFHG